VQSNAYKVRVVIAQQLDFNKNPADGNLTGVTFDVNNPSAQATWLRPGPPQPAPKHTNPVGFSRTRAVARAAAGVLPALIAR
jgi:hypothetical protein